MIHVYLTEEEIKNLNQLHTIETCGQCRFLNRNSICEQDSVIKDSSFLICSAFLNYYNTRIYDTRINNMRMKI